MTLQNLPGEHFETAGLQDVVHAVNSMEHPPSSAAERRRKDAWMQAEPTSTQDVLRKTSLPRDKLPVPARDWGTSMFGCFQEPVHAALCCVCACGCGSAYTVGQTRLLLDDTEHVPRLLHDASAAARLASALRLAFKSRVACSEGCVYWLSFCTGVSCMWSFTNRVQMRESYGIRGNQCADFAAHCCCHPCAVRAPPHVLCASLLAPVHASRRRP